MKITETKLRQTIRKLMLESRQANLGGWFSRPPMLVRPWINHVKPYLIYYADEIGLEVQEQFGPSWKLRMKKLNTDVDIVIEWDNAKFELKLFQIPLLSRNTTFKMKDYPPASSTQQDIDKALEQYLDAITTVIDQWVKNWR